MYYIVLRPMHIHNIKTVNEKRRTSSRVCVCYNIRRDAFYPLSPQIFCCSSMSRGEYRLDTSAAVLLPYYYIAVDIILYAAGPACEYKLLLLPININNTYH